MDLQGLARAQQGVVSRAQALQVLTDAELRWRLSSGRWLRVYPGVYQVHTGPVAWPTRVSAGLLHAGAGAAIGHRAAAHLHGFLPAAPPMVVVCVPEARRVRRVPGLRVVRRRRLVTCTRRGLAVTSAAMTALDLGDLPGVPGREAVGWVADAVRCRACTVDDLVADLGERRTHQHRRLLELSLGVVAQGAESGLEVGFVRSVLVAHGLPSMRLQVPGTLGGRSIRRDFENEEYAVVVEVDGRLGHEGSGALHDRVRDRRAARSGRVTLRAGWADVEYEACELALDLHGTLVSRGYRGVLRACGPRCRAVRRAVG
jgi:hypothetical protein